MKCRVSLIVCFIIMPLLAYSQTVTLKITGEGEALIGAHVYANGKIVTATNANGIATVNANTSDKITISYIGYVDETVTLSQKMISAGNITVYMQPTVFNIDEAKITRAKSDIDILKAKLKKGLKLRVSPNNINFTNIDTILDINGKGYCIAINGNAIFKSKGKQPIINITSIKLLTAFKYVITDTMKLENSDSTKLVTKQISKNIGNPMAVAHHIYQFRKMKIFYRGREDNKDIFYFSYTHDKNNKIDGLVYLNEHGVIERINNNYISPTSKYTTYHLDTSFEYFSCDNTILPKSYLRKMYGFDDNMEIIVMMYESIELFHDNKK